MGKIKVLMFGWEFPPFNSGGLGTACLGLSKALSKKEVELLFVLPRKMAVSSDEFKLIFADSPKIKLKFIDSIIKPYLTAQEYLRLLSLDKNNLYGRNLFEEVLRYALEAEAIAQEYDFDIIHAHDWFSFKAAIAAKKISNKPLIVHIHSTEIDRTGGHNINQEIFQIEKMGMLTADQVITVSNLTKKMIIQNYGIPDSKIRVIHNGIDLENYQNWQQGTGKSIHAFQKTGFKIVIFVGRITLQKGPDYFLKSAKKVLQFFPKVIFVIVGSGDLEYQIIEQAANLGISDKVFFAGFLRGSELQSIYKLADLFVMPSVSEPFGITALESVINHTPVLISKQSGVTETLKHVLTSDFWDTDDMAAKILAVLNYPSLRLSLTHHAFEQVKAINWEVAAQKCIDTYRNVLDNYFKG